VCYLQIDSHLTWQHRFAAETSTSAVLKGFFGWFGIAADACRLHCQGTELADQPLAQVLSCMLLVKTKM